MGRWNERSRNVQKASTYIGCCVAADDARIEIDGATIDANASTLHAERYKMSVQWGVEMG